LWSSWPSQAAILILALSSLDNLNIAGKLGCKISFCSEKHSFTGSLPKTAESGKEGFNSRSRISFYPSHFQFLQYNCCLLGTKEVEMTRIYLVRHGRAAASWADDLDPGLDALGVSQAEAAAEELANHMPLQVLSSPLKRALETSQPFTRMFTLETRVEPRVAEIPSPGMDLASRGPWLGKIMQGTWSDTSPELQNWRRALIDSLCELQNDTVVFSHFIAINVAVGSATGDDRVVHFRPDNGSISILETNGSSLTLIEHGADAQTHVG
jgi:broad specificity phosphatase PhoE